MNGHLTETQSLAAPLAPPRRARAAPPAVLARLAEAAGIRFNGDRPWDIQVRNPAVYRRILSQWSLGLGEAYIDGLWEAERLDETICRFLRAGVDSRVVRGTTRLRLAGRVLVERLINRQSVARAFQVGERHYDIGNAVYQAMLDPTMSYSCGYWKDANTLDQAQVAKLDLICRKLELAPGQKLLDIGCGWGGLAKYAAENYGVEVVGVTVSQRQQALARERCRGLPVSIELMDYRALRGRFDRVVSVGMFEHVGDKNYPAFFDVVERVMDEQALMLLHTIGSRTTSHGNDPWIDKYIFPNGKLPSARQIVEVIEGRFILEDWHNFGPDYDRTLMAWWKNFDAAWPTLRGHAYDERFYRMWKYYLHCCAGLFRAREGQLWQLVLSKQARTGTYRTPR
ncbi:MAG: cyclopropane fatty acyl phospholipid synthase [Chromatiaceae bacterium]